jgi:hypothetical protein
MDPTDPHVLRLEADRRMREVNAEFSRTGRGRRQRRDRHTETQNAKPNPGSLSHRNRSFGVRVAVELTWMTIVTAV